MHLMIKFRTVLSVDWVKPLTKFRLFRLFPVLMTWTSIPFFRWRCQCRLRVRRLRRPKPKMKVGRGGQSDCRQKFRLIIGVSPLRSFPICRCRSGPSVTFFTPPGASRSVDRGWGSRLPFIVIRRPIGLVSFIPPFMTRDCRLSHSLLLLKTFPIRFLLFGLRAT